MLMDNFVRFKGYGAKRYLLRNFGIKVGDCGDEQTFEQAAQETGTTARRRSGSMESIQNISRFSVL